MNLNEFLKPTKFIDSDSEATKNTKTDTEKAICLYYVVRDSIRYDPFTFYFNAASFIACNTLKRSSSYCIPKAILLAAVARAIGLPAQLGFSDVKNHLSTQKLLDLMETDVFIRHGYTLLYLDGK